MGDTQEGMALLGLCRAPGLRSSGQLPRLARAARRVQGRAHAAESIDHTPRLAVSGPLLGRFGMILGSPDIFTA
jgi:hypothetical protein